MILYLRVQKMYIYYISGTGQDEMTQTQIGVYQTDHSHRGGTEPIPQTPCAVSQ